MKFYKHNGKELPRVTGICSQLDKPALIYWSVNCAVDYILERMNDPELVTNKEDMYPIIESAKKKWRSVSAQALDIGSALHKAIEHYLKTGKEPQSPSDEVLSAFVGFLEWLDNWDSWETVKTEYTMYADRFAGTCDWVVYLNKKKYIVDFKTYNENSKSKLPYEEAKYQISAYRSIDETIEGSGILYLGKSTGKQVWIDLSDSYEKDLETFHILLNLWESRNG